MNFKNLYNETIERTKLMLKSLWVPGFHKMRPMVSSLLDRENLLADPVFQSIFPWEQDNTGNWRNYLNPEVIKLLSIGSKFNPRTNQSDSWREASLGKSIVVTSGTGSGKTECFMYPVLNYAYEHKNEPGIKAIFLYPLNALMEDQRDRLYKLCEKLGLTFAVYNGSTPPYGGNNDTNQTRNRITVEYKNRKSIRENCPDILLTNPSMLEYMLVRDKDQPMLNRSQGSLKWIAIDEAHTYSGSGALELKWELRRTINAFGEIPSDVQFACTSATIADPTQMGKLKDFISQLTGKQKNDISVITGNRIVPPLSLGELSRIINNDKTLPSPKNILKLRKDINSCDGMDIHEIWNVLYPSSKFDMQKALDVLDRLCDIKYNNDKDMLLALRMHLYLRTINGIYACGNPLCTKQPHDPQFGYITTHKSTHCDCGSPLFELRQCSECHSFLLAAQDEGNDTIIPMLSDESNEPFNSYFSLKESDNLWDENDDDEINESRNALFLLPIDKGSPVVSPKEGATSQRLHLELDQDQLKINTTNSSSAPDWLICEENRGYRKFCPNCGCNLQKKRGGAMAFRNNAADLNSGLASVFLKQTSPQPMEWGKYIAFTDSRQGTAVSAKLFNIEEERNIARKRAYDKLMKVKTDEEILEPHRRYWKENFDKDLTQEDIDKILSKVDKNQTLSLKEVVDIIYDERIYLHLINQNSEFGNNLDSQRKESYQESLLRQFIGRKPIKGNSAETLGLLQLDYPALKNVKIVPHALEQNHLSIDEWRDFLKIILDYYVRMGNHIQPLTHIIGSYRKQSYPELEFLRDTLFPKPIGAPDVDYSNRTNNNGEQLTISPWPNVVLKQNATDVSDEQPRLIRLLCIALGIENNSELQHNINIINNILKEAFNQLVTVGLLKNVVCSHSPRKDQLNSYDSEGYDGTYYLDLSSSVPPTQVKVKNVEKLWVCPVNNSFLDTIFKGYSPNIEKGGITPESMEAYKVDLSKTYNSKDIFKRAIGDLWTDRHEPVVETYQKSYLAAEHSGQQDRQLLEDYTNEFKADPIPLLNVLQCSTTMEMGVDIGDIEFVLLTTVPPTPANYLQRVGRAGRSGQSRAASVTFCNNTNSAKKAFNNPKWAIEARTGASSVLDSNIILQRHINAFFFRKFVVTEGLEPGIEMDSTISGFYANKDSFLNFLANSKTDSILINEFHKLFGNNVSYSIDKTEKAIQDILRDYEETVNELIAGIDNPQNSESKRRALDNQLFELQDENLLKYLSESQFLPNANMPTGILIFRAADTGDENNIQEIQNSIRRLIERRSNGERGLDQPLAEARKKLKRLKQPLILSRDGRTGLNEYAPGQSIVVDERNYRSSGLLLRGQYGDRNRQRFIYHCRNCGNVEYEIQLDENKECSRCSSPYHGILQYGSGRFTMAYEPIGFRSDVADKTSRSEMNVKRYFDIQPVLLGTQVLSPNCPLTETCKNDDDSGEILFFNAGTGFGFAICPICGRADIEEEIDYGRTTSLPNDFIGGHNRLYEKRRCDADADQIKRNVVLTARHQTCYTVMAFKNQNGQYLKDIETLMSLGTIIRRAFAEVMQLEEDEIDFGIRQESDKTLLYVYDTARGGCGYSTRLNDPGVCQKVFDKALSMLESYVCHCENNEGACANCLMDRTTMRFDNLLSKKKALDWLRMQNQLSSPVPGSVSSISPNAKPYMANLQTILNNAVRNPSTKEIILVMSDMPVEEDFKEALSATNLMGSILQKARAQNIPVNLLIEYHDNLHPEILDLIPYANIGLMFPNEKVKLVKDLGMGNLRPIALIDTDGQRQRFLSEDIDILSISEDWGKSDSPLYFDDEEISYEEVKVPEIKFSPKELFLDGMALNFRSDTSKYYRDIIKPALGLTTNMEEDIKNHFDGKKVKVFVGDPYLNNPLSVKMAIGLINELKGIYGFEISSIDFRVAGKKRNCNNDDWTEYSYASDNYYNEQAANEDILEECERKLNIIPTISSQTANHHRYLKFETAEGCTLEIRPDHGIAGGWMTNIVFRDIRNDQPLAFVKNRKKDEDILYYLLFKKK